MDISYANLKTLKHKNSEIELQAEVPLDAIARHESAALARMSRSLELPGFRKGKVPEQMVRERVDEAELLEEAAESALRAAVRAIGTDEKLEILGVPQLTVQELAPGKPISFKVRFALMPKIELPDYKKIGREISEKKEPVSVSDEEIREATDHILKIAAHSMKKTDTDRKSPDETKPDSPLPKLTDELVQKLGNFKTVAGFNDQLRNDLLAEKERRAKDTQRDEILKNIVKRTTLELPEMLVEQEFQEFKEGRDAELERAGTTLAQYLERVKKTEADLEKEERRQISERLTTSLVFGAIQEKEGIEAGEKELAVNVAFLARRYPHEDPASLRRTAEAFVIQEKIFKLFELEPQPADAKPKPEK
jgi:FKBP-type peptidyl-prolyl cis-trans isomerase (trigger factor)